MKKKNSNDMQDFRPISILPVLAKVTEGLLADQIVDYFEREKLLHPAQSAFRANHSCSTATIKILDDIRTSFDRSWLTIICFLDFTKAFDSIDHKLIVIKLKRYGFCDTSIKLIMDYLKGRMQCVKIGENFSSYRNVISGVPQGSVLGPILFTIFINDIFSVCQHVEMHAYADDIQLYLSRPPGLLEDLCARLNEDLSNICKWSDMNILRLNPHKSVILPIHHSQIDTNDIPSICVGNVNLAIVHKTKNLGIVLNSKLNAVDHINYVLRNLRFSSDCLPRDTKIKLVKQLILPFVDYFANIYCNLDSSSLHKLNVALNNCTRYVYGLNRYDRIEGRLKNLLGCDSLVTYLNIRNSILLHKIIMTNQPPYLFEKLQFCRSTRNMNIVMPLSNFLNSRRLFFINAIKGWNSLPSSIKTMKDFGGFKLHLTQFLNNH